MDNTSYKIENRRYTGSKAKLISWIMPLINKKCNGGIFADIFAGKGVVAAAASDSFKHIIINDFLYSNYAFYKAFFEKGKWSKERLKKIIKKYNNIHAKSLKDNFFSKNFGSKYFSKETAKIIGFIREDIEKNKSKLTKKEYFILLASLLYTADKAANTVGHYDSYLRRAHGNKKFALRLIEPIKVKKVDIFRKDANLLVENLRADVVYIDPPYNSRQYSRFYHLLETLTKWDKPKLYGIALKPKPENTSDYCRVKAPVVFKDLINKLNCKYIVVSYNNTYNSKSGSSRNKIKLDQIKNILKQRGKTAIFKKSYKFFNSGKTEFNNHKEYLFITKVYG